MKPQHVTMVFFSAFVPQKLKMVKHLITMPFFLSINHIASSILHAKPSSTYQMKVQSSSDLSVVPKYLWISKSSIFPNLSRSLDEEFDIQYVALYEILDDECNLALDRFFFSSENFKIRSGFSVLVQWVIQSEYYNLSVYNYNP